MLKLAQDLASRIAPMEKVLGPQRHLGPPPASRETNDSLECRLEQVVGEKRRATSSPRLETSHFVKMILMWSLTV